MEIDQQKMIVCANPLAFYTWLERNHQDWEEVWLRIYKKSSGIDTVTWVDSVRMALCWGWIDGIKKTFDEISYAQRFTPRRANSVWSQRNREHVESLIASGEMRPAGLAKVEAAKADGRWDNAYKPVSEMTVPTDFVEAVQQIPAAYEHFQQLNKANLYGIAYRLTTAKKPETRQRRFEKLLAMMVAGEKLG